MFESLKSYCSKVVSLTPEELALIDKHFEELTIKKKEYLLEAGKSCHFIAFISSGSIRHFHIKNGVEKTCDISFENTWVTDFQSFNTGAPGVIGLQAMEESVVYLVKRERLFEIYRECSKYETFGRLMAENVAQRSTDIAMSLSSEKPEERFENLLAKQPDLFQRVPQKYIANFLGISPESLSRIRRRIFTKLKS